MRHAHLWPLAVRGAAMGVRRVGLGPRLIEEQQTSRIQARLGTGPRLATLVYVRAALPARMTGLLLARHPVPDEEAVQRTRPEGQARLRQRLTHFLDRQVGPAGEHPGSLLAMLFDPTRATIATQRLGTGIALRGRTRAPPADASDAPPYRSATAR